MSKYKCPCCGKAELEEYDTICTYCGWDDCMEDRGDEEFDNSGVNACTLNQGKELLAQNKNVDGGTLPFFNWIKITSTEEIGASRESIRQYSQEIWDKNQK